MSSQGFRKLLFGSVLLFGGVGFVLGFFGSELPQLDVLAHFRLHFLTVFLTGLAVVMMPRHGFKLLALGGFITLGLHPAIARFDAPWQSNRAFADAGSANARIKPDEIKSDGIKSNHAIKPGEIKIVSLNSWHRHKNHQGLLSFLAQEDADIVVLAEFGPNKRYLLKALAKRYPYQAECAQIWSCSMVLLSKFKFSAHGVNRPSRDLPSIVWGTFDFGGQKLSVVGTHLYRPIDDMKRHRREMRGLAKYVRTLPGEIVVAGDFNSTPWADSFRLFRDGAQLAASDSYLPSWPAVAPQLAIDHLFRSKNIRVRSLSTAHAMGSDHLPLVANIEIIPAGSKFVSTAQLR